MVSTTPVTTQQYSDKYIICVCHVFVLCFILDPPPTPPPQLSAAAIAIAGAISGNIFVLAVLFVLITCVSVNKSTNVIAFGGFQRSYTG